MTCSSRLLGAMVLSSLASLALAEDASKRDVLSVAFSPDGALLAAGGKDECVRVWGVDELGRGAVAPAKTFKGHGFGVSAMAFTRDGKGDRKSTRLNSSHIQKSRMPSSA